MEENLLKLDMLGHDDPTMIRMLEDMTGVDAQKIPLDDQDTMSIFTSSKVLGYENDPILGPVGSVAIPEFGTGFTRGMLQETQPTKFDTLIRLSGSISSNAACRKSARSRSWRPSERAEVCPTARRRK